MKQMLVLGLFLVGAAVQAEPAYVAECRKAAVKKLGLQAQARGYVLDKSSVRVTEIDDRFYNPFKYVWFAGQASNGKEEITLQKLTQKNILSSQPCF